MYNLDRVDITSYTGKLTIVKALRQLAKTTLLDEFNVMQLTIDLPNFKREHISMVKPIFHSSKTCFFVQILDAHYKLEEIFQDHDVEGLSCQKNKFLRWQLREHKNSEARSADY